MCGLLFGTESLRERERDWQEDGTVSQFPQTCHRVVAAIVVVEATWPIAPSRRARHGGYGRRGSRIDAGSCLRLLLVRCHRCGASIDVSVAARVSCCCGGSGLDHIVDAASKAATVAAEGNWFCSSSSYSSGAWPTTISRVVADKAADQSEATGCGGAWYCQR